MKIKISSGDTELTGVIEHESFSEKLKSELPVESTVRTWGEEVYFELPVQMEVEPDATDVVDPGTITFWCQGNAMAIPYGITPASRDDECRLAAAVNLLGKLEEDPERLSSMSAGDTVRVESV